jgi:Ca-activated chloride channel family protein
MAFCPGAVAQQAGVPVSVAVVLDTSGSMGGKLRLARQIVSDVLQPAIAGDEIAVIAAADRPVEVRGFVRAADAVEAIASAESKGRSALLDAIQLGLERAKTASNVRRVLLVISDGGDNGSRHMESEIRTAIRDSGVRVYFVGIHEPIAGRGRTAEELGGAALLERLAGDRGRYIGVDRGSDVSAMAAEIRAAMRALP